MNELATALFKNLIDSGYKYLTNANNYSITFTINDINYNIFIVRDKYKEVEPIKFEPSHLLYDCFYDTISNNNKVNDTIFRINFNHRHFDIKFSRVEFAQYLDKIEDMINKWYKDQMINVINFLDNELEEID